MKPGLRTTEFWLVIFGFVLVVLGGLRIEQNLASFALDLELSKWWLGGVLAYIAGRSIVKSNGIKKEIV